MLGIVRHSKGDVSHNGWHIVDFPDAGVYKHAVQCTGEWKLLHAKRFRPLVCPSDAVSSFCKPFGSFLADWCVAVRGMSRGGMFSGGQNMNRIVAVILAIGLALPLMATSTACVTQEQLGILKVFINPGCLSLLPVQ
jgi:hypothetical protein